MNSEGNRLTSAEISHLWNSYVLVSMLHHIMLYFLSSIEDNDIRTYFEYARYLSRVHVDEFASAFTKEGLPVPRGTTSEDVNINAPRLGETCFNQLCLSI